MASDEENKVTGHLVEIFSSFQGEGGSVRGSCFGRRQIFIRFAGCDLRCIWCDTAKSRDPNYPTCQVEDVPGTWKFSTHKNPVDEEFVIEQVLKLSTRDFHSVSLTGVIFSIVILLFLYFYTFISLKSFIVSNFL